MWVFKLYFIRFRERRDTLIEEYETFINSENECIKNLLRRNHPQAGKKIQSISYIRGRNRNS